MEIKNFCFKNNLSFIPVTYKGKIYDPPKGWKEFSLDECNNYDDTNKMGFLIDTKNKFVILDTDDQVSEKYVRNKIDELKLNMVSTKSNSNYYDHIMCKKHFWFKVPENYKVHKKCHGSNGVGHKIFGCLDILTDIAEHKEEILDPDEMSVIPETWLEELMDRQIKDVKSDHKNDVEINKEKYTELLNILKDERATNFKTWIDVGMILKNESNELLDAYDVFSKRGGSNYKGIADIVKRWDQFKNSGDLKIGTLCLMAKEDDEKKFKKWQAKYKTSNDSEYISQKEELEKEYFYLKDTSCFGYYDSKGQLIFKSKQDLLLDYAHDVDFAKKWIADINKRSYNRIDFIPNNNDPKVYNLFSGFKYNNNNPINHTKLKIFLDLIDYLFVNKEDVDTILDWFSWIRQRPERKTEKSLVIYSDNHGVGKNTFIQFFLKIIDNYYAKINKIEDLSRQFNSQLANKLLVYGDEITCKAKDLRSDLKNFITQTEINIERKNHDAVKMKDLTNYIFTSNSANAFFIEPSDRRFILFEIDKPKLPDDKCNELYKLLEDNEMLESLDTYLKNRPIPDKLTAYMTSYKKKLIAQCLPAYIQMVYCEFRNFSTIPRQWYIDELFERAIVYAKSHYLESTFSRDKMCKDLKTEFSEHFKHGKKGNYYLFPDVEKFYKYLKLKRPELMFVDENDIDDENVEEV